MNNWRNLGQAIGGETTFAIPDAIRRQHLYVLGRTGSGKSTLLARMALSDIASGAGLLVLDPHGDLVEDIIDHCPDEHRDRVIYLDPSDREHPVPMNLFECRPEQDKDTICSEVIGVFKRLYGEFWGPQLEDLLRSLTLVMLNHQFLDDERVDEAHRYNATLKEAHDFLFDRQMRAHYYPFVANDMVKRFWIDFYDTLGTQKGAGVVSREQVRYASSTTNKLRRLLLNPVLFDITCNSKSWNPLDLRTLMDDRKVLLVNLSKGRLGEDNSSLLGSVLLSRLVVAALSRADLPRSERSASLFHVIADEFQSFATDSFKLLLSEARKYGITLTIAHQHRGQLDNEMKGAALNCGSLIAFRLLGNDASDVGREFDATPQQRGWKYEPRMVHRRSNEAMKSYWRHDVVRPVTNWDDDGDIHKSDQTMYDRIPDYATYAETERAVANSLTQLPNFQAMVRLADGSHHLVGSADLPLETEHRAGRIEHLRQRTRDRYALQPSARRSVASSDYLSNLQRQEARDYEAELDEQPLLPPSTA